MKILLFCAIFCVQFYGLLFASKPKVICYWPNWQLEAHPPEKIDPTLCTHIHHAFHFLDDKNNVVKDRAGPQPEVYNRLLALKQKNPELKVVISLGGASEKGDKYSHLVNNETLRHEFIKNTIQYLHKYNFDGLDIDWEYPVCWGGNCAKGPKSDKDNFGKFIQELRTAFDRESPRFSLSAAVAPGVAGRAADQAYDFKSLAENLDYIGVMTYGGGSEQKTTHHSKLSFSKSATQFYVTRGVPKEKVLMGVPFYGHTYKLADKTKHNIGDPIDKEGKNPLGEAPYSEICNLVKNHGWTKELSDNGHDPIAYHELTWLDYDDPYAAYDKSKWIKDNGYGGIIIWEVNMDDQNKNCCSVTYPLLRAINHGLYGTGTGPETYGCEHK